MTVFLPWRSEFGIMILRVVRFIHQFSDEEKIVCIKRGMESLYPSASSFIYDWEDVPDMMKNTRLKRDGAHKRYMRRLGAKLRETYPTAHFVWPCSREPNDPAWNFRPEPRVRRGLDVDIVIGPRHREYALGRNFKHWQHLTDQFNSLGYTVGAIGAADTSETQLQGLKYRSWDFDVLDAGIEMLQNCKLAVMTDSGGAHLSVLCGAPLKVIYGRPGRTSQRRWIKWHEDEVKRLAVNHCEPILGGWLDPARVVNDVVQYLTATNTKQISHAFSFPHQ